MIINEITWFLITVLVGVIGGSIAIKLKVPVGGILGAMVAVVIMNVITGDHAIFYSNVKLAVQLTVGAVSGSKVGRSEFKGLKTIAFPALVIFPCMLFFNLIFGALIFYFSSLDAYTSFYSLSPGSIADIAIVAAELGADESVVGLIHAIRVLVCSAVLPPIFVFIQKNKRIPTDKANIEKQITPSAPEKNVPRLIGLFIVSAAGGLLFKLLGIKGGAIIGSMCFSILYTCVVGKCQIPKKLKRIQQLSTGIYVGSGVTTATLLGIATLTVPIILLVADILISTLVTTFFVMKTKKIDLVSALASSAPGGMTEILLITDELGGDTTKVGIVHAFRIFLVIALFPPFINLVIQILMRM